MQTTDTPFKNTRRNVDFPLKKVFLTLRLDQSIKELCALGHISVIQRRGLF